MSEYPSSWVEVTLGTLFSFNYGKSLPERARSGSDFPVYGSNGMIGYHNSPLTNGESIIIGRKGSVGEVHFCPISCFPIDTTYYIDQFYGMPVKYWFYQLKNLRLSELNKATAIPGVNRQDAYQIKIYLSPLEEQKRIADKLDKLFTRIDACCDRLARIPQILEKFRQNILDDAISGYLTEDWRQSENTDSWLYENAENICNTVQNGGTPKEGFIEEPGIPFLKVYNLVNQKIDFEYRPQFISENIHKGKLSKSCARPGDVLMNIVGPPLGKVAIVPTSFSEWNINQAITLFRPSERITTNWLYYFFCSGSSVAEIFNETRGSAGQRNISLSQCRNFSIPVPPIKEQEEIVCRIEKLFSCADLVESHYLNALGKIEELKSLILEQAFRGELVPQDASDKPASELLDRIRTERLAQPPRPKRSPINQWC